jgi:single-strand DNA-binding protein
MSKATFSAVGKLSREPKGQFTPQGTAITFLSFPVHSGYGDKQKTVWVSATVFGAQAEACNKYLDKGKRVFLTGEISGIRQYDKSDGTVGVELQVKAYDVTFLDGASVVEDDQHEPEAF